MDFDAIYINQPLLKRLEGFDFKASGYEDEEGEKVGVSGVLYGVGVPHLSRHAVVYNATGKLMDAAASASGGTEPPAASASAYKNVEFLSEVMPCGLEAYGVFHLNDQPEAPERIDQLVGQMPEQLLAVRDPLVILRQEGKIRGYLMHEGKLVEYPVKAITPYQLETQHITTVRIRGKVNLQCALSAAEITTAFQHLIEKVSSPYGSFQLEGTNLHFLHTLERKNVASVGWVTGGDDFNRETTFEEDCMVTNLHELGIGDDVDIKAQNIDQLWRAQSAASLDGEDKDDGFGVPVEIKKKKDVIIKRQTMNFRLRMKMSGDACTSKTLNCAPVIHYEKRNMKSLKIPLNIDAIGLAPNSMTISSLMEILKGSVQRQIHEMARSFLSEFKMRKTLSLPEACHLYPRPFGHFVSIIYTKTGTCAAFAQFRKHLHKMFLLPVDRPYFRRQNRFKFNDEKTIGKGPLINVHVGLEKPAVGGEMALVEGIYSYHHYMQDKFNDDGWGCAYRSLQTIISWFRHQGYTDTEIPTHGQIQKCLISIGDKEKSFQDSKQWIGSTEVGYVLDTACKVQSKFLSVNSGDEMPSKGRELLHHFKTHGTPVMIGGGVLAHTILGVEWNEESGDVRWLILDPHFTGADWTSDGRPNIAQMQSKGWVGWKGPDFWVKSAFYNMCMPLRPKSW